MSFGAPSATCWFPRVTCTPKTARSLGAKPFPLGCVVPPRLHHVHRDGRKPLADARRQN